MTRIEQIKLNYKNGRMTFADMEWMMDTIEQQYKTISNLRLDRRFSRVLALAQENLELQERLDTVKREFEAFKRAR